MSAGLLGFVTALVVAAIIVFPLGGALRRCSGAFYAVALVLTGIYVWALLSGASLVRWRFLALIFQKGYLASILLGVVMFTGCLDSHGALRHKLQPNRGSLSILSFIFILGHLATYAPSFVARLGVAATIKGNVMVSLAIAVVLTLLFAVLTITSVRVVRRAMGAKSWKNLQRTAYLMVALLVLHVGIALGGSAFNGRFTLATGVFVAYVAVVAVYAVLRVRRYMLDRRGASAGTAAGATGLSEA